VLDKVRGIHQGKKIAILGTAPSLTLYSRAEAVTIGVNGASSILEPGDYFVANDTSSHLRSWFRDAPEGLVNIIRGSSAIQSSRLYPDDSSRAEIIRSYEKFLEQNQDLLVTLKDGVKIVDSLQLQNEFFGTVPEPVPPHMIIRYMIHPSRGGKITRGCRDLVVGGTVACIASQIAFHMGASEIHLYGVEFSNQVKVSEPEGNNYFYRSANQEGGYTTNSQRRNFEEAISAIMGFGVPIFSHGPTNIENTIRLAK
jgi:hypothetical protein